MGTLEKISGNGLKWGFMTGSFVVRFAVCLTSSAICRAKARQAQWRYVKRTGTA